ncbi:MAG TPA: GTPase HflX, partial [Myxococcota bacterium]|nr:GTPase HflX [Myxococcota bacterium]
LRRPGRCPGTGIGPRDTLGGRLQELFGNTEGLGSAESRALQAFYRRRLAATEFLSLALARELVEVSRQVGRRVGLLIDRQGAVVKVVVGDAHRVFLPDLGPRRAGAARFRGVRLVLSSLRPDGLTDEDLTDLVLLQLDAVMVVHVRSDGNPGDVHYAHLLPPEASDKPWQVERVPDVGRLPQDWRSFISDLEGRFARSPHLRKIDDREGAILVGLVLGQPRKARRRMEELHRLATTAGFRVLDDVLQGRSQIDGRTFVGKGKLQELIVHSMRLGADALLFDRELSPSQMRNIAEETELKVLDRTQVILDIFAQHATTREGKLQVELAQLRYRMPRLAIMPRAMSRLTGGVGGRGPGETTLEINKRRAQERLTRLERSLEEIARGRETRRALRKRNDVPVVAIVGYTNAGKSTLLNRVTNASVLVEDKLFATLDPTSRRFRFPEEREILLTDTVGFIEDLPDTLVRAFKSTLEEVQEAHVLVHVLDASDEQVEAQHDAVVEILRELEAGDKPRVLVWNKADQADAVRLRELMDRFGGFAISALTGDGCEQLLGTLERMLFLERRAREVERREPEAPEGDA